MNGPVGKHTVWIEEAFTYMTGRRRLVLRARGLICSSVEASVKACQVHERSRLFQLVTVQAAV